MIHLQIGARQGVVQGFAVKMLLYAGLKGAASLSVSTKIIQTPVAFIPGLSDWCRIKPNGFLFKMIKNTTLQ